MPDNSEKPFERLRRNNDNPKRKNIALLPNIERADYTDSRKREGSLCSRLPSSEPESSEPTSKLSPSIGLSLALIVDRITPTDSGSLVS